MADHPSLDDPSEENRPQKRKRTRKRKSMKGLLIAAMLGSACSFLIINYVYQQGYLDKEGSQLFAPESTKPQVIRKLVVVKKKKSSDQGAKNSQSKFLAHEKAAGGSDNISLASSNQSGNGSEQKAGKADGNKAQLPGSQYAVTESELMYINDLLPENDSFSEHPMPKVELGVAKKDQERKGTEKYIEEIEIAPWMPLATVYHTYETKRVCSLQDGEYLTVNRDYRIRDIPEDLINLNLQMVKSSDELQPLSVEQPGYIVVITEAGQAWPEEKKLVKVGEALAYPKIKVSKSKDALKRQPLDIYMRLLKPCLVSYPNEGSVGTIIAFKEDEQMAQ
ncbi:MAG: hypothetical protein HQL32_10135 [Planctomycetes bacterium]|nr:hypothetical protein [Planctomycetota bacterium]